MKNPFTAKLRGQLSAVETKLAAAEKERDAALTERDAQAAKLLAVEPSIERRANDLAIDRIASAGVLGPILAGEGVTGSRSAPRSKQEFVEAYNRIGDAEEAAAYFEQHKGVLDD